MMMGADETQNSEATWIRHILNMHRDNVAHISQNLLLTRNFFALEDWILFTSLSFIVTDQQSVVCCLVWFGLVWFICSTIQSHTYHWTCQLQIIIYNTTNNIWTSTQYNIINNNTKFKDQLEVEFATTSMYICI
jgi:hypothetical protein